jgi:hypothetical protein
LHVFGQSYPSPTYNVLTLQTPLTVLNGGSGSSTAAGARTNFGLGTIATQNANAVAITGGTVDGACVGCTTPAAGSFTTNSSSSNSKVFATNTSSQSIPNATTTAVTNWTTTFDTNSNFTASTGTFAAPRNGYYHVSASIQFVGVAWTSGNSEVIAVFKNGVIVAQVQSFVVANYTGSFSSVPISVLVNCNATDTITLRVFQNSGGALALSNTASLMFLSIEQIT